ncbi:GerMN domain-containing protein [Evansella cellulosilytica]|uniref:Lipoprotein LpqB, GerMN domain n=1 Tax=Evansella cellulosilytica (strain ATCC 21833 / DSM 2522 / FERM P-1141 / JCM 9156 / N-4) TaxID=649639 RepID=E6TZT4_EVAC2|nr:GerMN domain-containing protein [Evansella cellulosilytica]ADU31390.1 Lipoprotein LpqB, GerMN domain [Evansella cellulosilytica DSM 2522]
MRRLKLKSGWLLIVAAAVTLTACGSDPVDDVLQEIDPPQQINFVDEEEGLEVDLVVEEDGDQSSSTTDMDGDGVADEAEEKGGTVSETVMRELYLVDSNGLVAPQSVNLPRGDSELEGIVQYLVQGGPVTELLPNGFQAVLPSGTEILNAEVQQGTATLNLSEQFTEYHPQQEMQILQALTWTVTQLDGVDSLKLQLDGEELSMMPQNGTPISSSGYTRNHGINLEMSDQADLVNTKSVVLYFLSQTDDQTYYVPVTRRVNQDDDLYEAVVGELIKGPGMMSPLLTEFSNGVELLDAPQLANGTLTLNFNEALLNMSEGTALSEYVLNMIVYSLTEQPTVENVSLQVDSESSIEVNSGETLTEPVARPNMVNTGEY